MLMYDLHDKTVVISGASGGFGGELVKLLIKRYRCRVVGIGRDREKMLRLAYELGEDRTNFRFILFDASVRDNWEKLAAKLEKDGGADMLINCAGVLPGFERFDRTGSEGVRRIMEINFMSAVYSCESLLPVLKSSGHGCIVNVASSAAIAPLVGTCAYSASKGALKNFTQALQSELSPRIYVALVCPGFSRTGLFRDCATGRGDALIDAISTDKKTVARLICAGLGMGMKLIVPGADSLLMTTFSSVLPTVAPAVYRECLRAADTALFSSVFAED